MNSTDSKHQHAITTGRLVSTAAISLGLGILVYAFGRPVPPVLMSDVLAALGLEHASAPESIPFAYQLPSFFHMLTLLLLVLAVTLRQPHLRIPALTVTLVLGLALEFVQHPMVLAPWSACMNTPACRAFSGLYDYARAGTFDPADLLAIICAALVSGILLRLLTRSNDTYPIRRESIA